jgi:hypothetical protein
LLLLLLHTHTYVASTKQTLLTCQPHRIERLAFLENGGDDDAHTNQLLTAAIERADSAVHSAEALDAEQQLDDDEINAAGGGDGDDDDARRVSKVDDYDYYRDDPIVDDGEPSKKQQQ